jgi:hypothetical protein
LSSFVCHEFSLSCLSYKIPCHFYISTWYLIFMSLCVLGIVFSKTFSPLVFPRFRLSPNPILFLLSFLQLSYLDFLRICHFHFLPYLCWVSTFPNLVSPTLHFIHYSIIFYLNFRPSSLLNFHFPKSCFPYPSFHPLFIIFYLIFSSLIFVEFPLSQISFSLSFISSIVHHFLFKFFVPHFCWISTFPNLCLPYPSFHALFIFYFFSHFNFSQCYFFKLPFYPRTFPNLIILDFPSCHTRCHSPFNFPNPISSIVFLWPTSPKSFIFFPYPHIIQLPNFLQTNFVRLHLCRLAQFHPLSNFSNVAIPNFLKFHLSQLVQVRPLSNIHTFTQVQSFPKQNSQIHKCHLLNFTNSYLLGLVNYTGNSPHPVSSLWFLKLEYPTISISSSSYTSRKNSLN